MKAYQLLNKKEKWTKGEYARDSKGKETVVRSENAVKWCVTGALMKLYSGNRFIVVKDKVNLYLIQQYGHQNVENWNDDPKTKWSEIHSVLKKLNI